MNINVGKIFCKTIGAAAIGVVGYDAFKRGQWQAKTNYKNTTADFMTQVHQNSQLLDENSQVRSDVKNSFNRWFLTSGVNFHLPAISGFFSGIGSSLVDNVVPLALATGALMLKRGAKYCVWGMGLYAAKYLLTDVIGIGKPNYLPDKV